MNNCNILEIGYVQIRIRAADSKYELVYVAGERWGRGDIHSQSFAMSK